MCLNLTLFFHRKGQALVTKRVIEDGDIDTGTSPRDSQQTLTDQTGESSIQHSSEANTGQLSNYSASNQSSRRVSMAVQESLPQIAANSQ